MTRRDFRAIKALTDQSAVGAEHLPALKAAIRPSATQFASNQGCLVDGSDETLRLADLSKTAAYGREAHAAFSAANAILLVDSLQVRMEASGLGDDWMDNVADISDLPVRPHIALLFGFHQVSVQGTAA